MRFSPAPTEADLPPPILISVDELATILGVSSRTVWRLLSAGKLLHPIRLGGVVRWRYAEVRQWIDDGCPPHSPTTKSR